MRKLAGVVVAGVAVLATAGWYWRDRLPVPDRFSLAPPAQQKPDVLYTWVDKDGVTHFEQDSGKGTRVVYDGERITPLVTPPAPPLPIETATGSDGESPREGLHKLRHELETGAQRMRESRQTRDPDL